MAKMQSTLKNMLLSLTFITLVAAAALSGIYILTQQRINDEKARAEQQAQSDVLAGDPNGVAIKVETDGFGGKMVVMVGFAQDGTILGYKILEHSETPGLGDKAGQWFQDANKPGQCIIGRNASQPLKVSKDGGDVDAITAATISSRAFLKAVNDAFVYSRPTPVEVSENADACSDATTDANSEASAMENKEETEVSHE